MFLATIRRIFTSTHAYKEKKKSECRLDAQIVLLELEGAKLPLCIVAV